MHILQDSFGCVTYEDIDSLAWILKISASEVYEVATFYNHFDVLPDIADRTWEKTIKICDSLSCAIQGAENLHENIKESASSKLRVQKVPCIGRCDSSPVAVVNGSIVGQANVAKIQRELGKKEYPRVENDYKSYQQYVEDHGYKLYLDCLIEKTDRTSVIKQLSESGLRGLGGAGFPAHRKWSIVSEMTSPKFLAVNIDEGEPGTFKDRFFLEKDPHRFLEGMLIAAWFVGASKCYIYIRDEYTDCRINLERELIKLKNAFPQKIPEIEMRRGAGAYICGEESAMIESIEGKRGMPRLRPPYIAEAGLFGRPTLEHNMETLYWVREILEKGGDWFASFGRRGRSGLRTFSVSGRIKKPGVYIAPAGISVNELITEYCGGMQDEHIFESYLPGGASGGILPAKLGHLPLDFDTLQPYGCFIGSAAIIVLSHKDSVKAAALNTMRFFRDESCGKCTPCRVGTSKAVSLMEKQEWDVPLLREIGSVMSDASICGLGQAAPNPLLSVLRHFSDVEREK